MASVFFMLLSFNKLMGLLPGNREEENCDENGGAGKQIVLSPVWHPTRGLTVMLLTRPRDGLREGRSLDCRDQR
jgi:hypothetical protein